MVDVDQTEVGWTEARPIRRVARMTPDRLPRRRVLTIGAVLGLLVTACSTTDSTDSDDPPVTIVIAGAAPTAATTESSTAAEAAPEPTEPVPTVPETSAPATSTSPETEPAAPPVDDTAAIAASRAFFADIAPDSPGCTVAVARRGQVVWAEAFGAARLDPLTPMTTETVVDIGSTSKQFTASAIGLLAGEGKVDLAAPLSDYVNGMPEWSDRVTVAQLIHHVSGVPDYIELLVGDGFEFTDVTTDADALRVLAEATELDFEPDTGWEYSNSNYFLLGQIVLAVTGDDLGAFLAERVFTPLGMGAVMDPLTTNPLKAASYEADGSGGWRNADSPWQQLGDGGVQTNPTELLKWAGQYWDPTIGGTSLDALRWAGMSVEPTTNTKYGFGIVEEDLDGRRVLSHSGGWGGFVTSFVVVPDSQLAVTGTCNAEAVLPAGVASDDFGDDIALAFLASN